MSATPLILVRSSINIDDIYAVPHIVRPGETLASLSLTSLAGGKGLNVSAATALAAGQPGRVFLAANVGDVTWPVQELERRGVDCSHVQSVDGATGRAVIQRAEDGENSIILLPGVNHAPGAAPAELLAALPRQPSYLILQNEIPWDVTTAYASFFGAKGTDVVFNPSPMPSQAQLEAFPWKQLAVLIVNEGEAADLLAALSPNSAASPSDAKATLETLVALPQFQSLKWLVLTLGSQGVLASVALQGARQTFASPASKPEAVRDTTGAGDTFAGNLVARLSEIDGELQPKQVEEALRWAGQAAAMAVEKEGALESIPKRQDVQQRLQG